MSEQSLKQKTTVGVIWSVLEHSSVQIIQFVLQIILARLLFPSDFGLIGMLAIFIVISRLFIDSGFANALIQKKNRTEKDFSTVFYFNIIVSTTCYLLLYLTAPLISDFYRSPELTRIMRILFLSLIINAFTLIPNTKLTIAMNFRKKAIINFLAIVLSGGIGVWMAYGGYGVWALVWQTLSSSVITLFLLLILAGWKPMLVFSKTSFRQLFNFGSKLLSAAIIDAVMDNLYTIMIGRYYKKDDLGYYTRGLLIPTVVSGTIASALINVIYPVMTSVQDDKEYIISIYRRVVRLVSFFVIPAMLGLAFISEPFVRYFMTEKWMPSVVLMQWMCLAKIFTPFSLMNINLLSAIGRSDIFLKVNLIRIPIVAIMLAITLPMGLKAIVIGNFVMSLIVFFINSYMPGKLFGYGAIPQLKDLLPSLLISLFMLAVMLLATCKIENDLMKISISFASGLSAYFIAASFFRKDEMREISSLLGKIIIKKNTDK